MNREIIKLARECADNCDGYGFAFYTRSLERLAALVSAKEREACAKVCEEHGKGRNLMERG